MSSIKIKGTSIRDSMSHYDNHKRNSFNTIMFSDPQHMIFVYNPQVKHLRLLELEKCSLAARDFAQNQYSSPNFPMNGIYTGNEEESPWLFYSKRCFLLDSQMATIQKQAEGRPISHHRRYQKILQQRLKKKIFNWYSQTDSILIEHSITQQYYHYQEINNFCFGRRHFVRVLNSIELASDHISRNHCEIAVARGRGTKEIKRYFDLLFGVGSKRGLKFSKRVKLSQGNILMQIPMQLWQKIYEYVFLTRDKYYLFDSGSRNGSFFIQCSTPNSSQQPASFEYSLYGNKIDINHKLNIRQGFSYQYEGEEYLMKAWRLTHDKMKTPEEEQNTYVKCVQQLIQQQFPLYMHNRRTIKNVQQFEQKINWFNNFEKVSKDYIIDDTLLKRHRWKGKKVYQDMIKNDFHQNNRHNSPRRNTNYMRSQSFDDQEFNPMTQNRPNQSYQPFSLLPPNPTSPENQFITKAQFVRLIYQEYLLMQKYLKIMSNQDKLNQCSTKSQSMQKYDLQTERIVKTGEQEYFQYQNTNERTKNSNSELSEQNLWKQASQFFINQHHLNAMVISLDFNNDFKKLYCIITEMNKPKKFHIGSQMIINTSRFQFDDHNKCNGYIQFNGQNWFIVALKPRNQIVPRNNFHHTKNKKLFGSLTDSQQSDSSEENDKKNRQFNHQKDQNQKAKNKQFFGGSKLKNEKIPLNESSKKKINKKGKKVDLQKQLFCKIWTKIPSMSQFQLNPHKCSRYILRLAHAFYFELKFINFNPSSQNQVKIDGTKA